MRTLPILLLASLLFGCDDTYVREHIIDNFVCVYMPWWMGECDGEEVTAKVESVLEHGFAEAQITCSAYLGAPGLGGGQGYHSYQATRLHDGACWVSVSLESNLTTPSYVGQGWSAAQFDVRGTAAATDCSVSLPVPIGGQQTLIAADGLLQVVGCTPATGTVCSAAIDEVCTGFNLEAFGVAP